MIQASYGWNGSPPRRLSWETGAENADDDEEEDSTTVLCAMLESNDWAGALSRIASHPAECMSIHQEGRRPLHLACADDAPAVVVQALCKAHPEASVMVGTSGMTPLHLTCSSPHASVHVVRVLLELGLPAQCAVRDLDGDTVLHTACRSGAPVEVLEVLLRANPTAVHERDYEGLTPLLRLWVRYVVTLGGDAWQDMADADLFDSNQSNSDLGQAWSKTVLLLRTAYYGSLEQPHNNNITTQSNDPYVVHAAAAIDCPRPVLQMAARVFATQLNQRDRNGLTPLQIAAQAPIFDERDLSDEGYLLEDVVHGDESSTDSARPHQSSQQPANKPNDTSSTTASSPSVLEILLQANAAQPCGGASVPDPLGRLPLHVALATGKRWAPHGVGALVLAYPEGLCQADPTGDVPFLLAARGNDADLDTAYQVLRYNPSVLTDVVEGKVPRQPR